jgi:hypothetical protein
MKTFSQFINEGIEDSAYKRAIQRIMKEVPWDSKPRKTKQSALHSIEGTVNGKELSFAWHQPDGKYSDKWVYLGVADADGKMDTGQKHPSIKQYDKDPNNWDLQKQNLKELDADIKMIGQMGK